MSRLHERSEARLKKSTSKTQDRHRVLVVGLATPPRPMTGVPDALKRSNLYANHIRGREDETLTSEASLRSTELLIGNRDEYRKWEVSRVPRSLSRKGPRIDGISTPTSASKRHSSQSTPVQNVKGNKSCTRSWTGHLGKPCAHAGTKFKKS